MVSHGRRDELDRAACEPEVEHPQAVTTAPVEHETDRLGDHLLIESDPFLGRLLTGRIQSGKAVPGMAIKALDREGKEIERGRITKVLASRGLRTLQLASHRHGGLQ